MCETKDGKYVITADATQLDFNTTTDTEDVCVDGRNIVYVRFLAAPVHAPASADSLYEKWDVMIMHYSPEYSLDEIRQGTPDNYITVWKKGDPIPAASEEMERYYALEKAYEQWFDALPEIDDGKAMDNDAFFAWQDRLDEARNAVPEWK